MITYAQKLKSPKWQKKRLEILELRKFTCSECDSEEKELHVHHRYYKKGREPWEYSPHELEVLCNECHERKHEVLTALRERIGAMTIREMESIVQLVDNYVSGPHSIPDIVGFIDNLYSDFDALRNGVDVI